MESPQKPEAKKTMGCASGLLRLAAIVLGLFVFEYVLSRTFHAINPADELTRTFIPYQNNYLAFTDAFITSEGMTSEFSDDTSATVRFLGNFILAFIGMIVITVALYIIPHTRKLMDYLWYGLYLPVVFVVLIYSFFFPQSRTVLASRSNTVRDCGKKKE